MRERQRTKHTKQRLWGWRWQSNPLRRHDHVVEAWIVLTMWTVIVLGSTVVGTMAARSADESLRQLRQDRYSVRAVLIEDAAKGVARAPGMSDDRVRAEVRWTAVDGSTRTGRTLVESGHKAGSKVLVWMDSKGELTTQPPTATQAAAQAGLLGTVAALALGGTAFVAGRVARWRLDRRRYEEWGRAWDRVGPQWGHMSA
jgi:hypothetical protein